MTNYVHSQGSPKRASLWPHSTDKMGTVQDMAADVNKWPTTPIKLAGGGEQAVTIPTIPASQGLKINREICEANVTRLKYAHPTLWVPCSENFEDIAFWPESSNASYIQTTYVCKLI